MTRRFAFAIILAAVTSTSLATTESKEREQDQASFAQGRSVADKVLDSLANQGVGPLAGKPLDTLIAEGDSWFSYPGMEVLGALAGGKITAGTRYSVYSAASAGDTVESMAYDGEQLEDFAGEFFKVRDALKQGAVGPVKAILLSGGGNDIAGPEFHMLLNHADSATGAISPLDGPVADAFIDRIVRSLESLIGTARRYSEAILGPNNIPILIHGYAPPVPDGRPFLFGWPLPGPWLQPGFASKGYVRENPADLGRNTAVMADLITRFNAKVAAIPDRLKGVADVRYVNLTKILTNGVGKEEYKTDWSNELHPRDAAFVRVADAIHQRIIK